MKIISKGEASLLEILKKDIPHYAIIPQKKIKIGFHKNLFIDYYIPVLKLAFEFDGRQHSEYVPYYHQDIAGFMRSKLCDEAKNKWCVDNGVDMIRVNYNEEVDAQTLRSKIRELIKRKLVNE